LQENKAKYRSKTDMVMDTDFAIRIRIYL